MWPQRITICGGGNAAHVLIARLAVSPFQVAVFAPFADEAVRLQTGIRRAGGLSARAGTRQWTGTPQVVSADPATAFAGSDLVLLALPAGAHRATLEAAAPYLGPGAWVVALPARGGFDWEAAACLGPEIVLAGLQTLPWACRIVPGRYGEAVEILGTKAVVDVAAQPAARAREVAARLQDLLGVALAPAASFLALTLANTGQLIHPGIMYGLFKDWDGTPFGEDEVPLFYAGVTEPIAAHLQAMSDDIQALCRGLRERQPQLDLSAVLGLHAWLLRSYPDTIRDTGSLQAAFVTNQAYTGLRAPTLLVEENALVPWFESRYLTEDVPFGLLATRGIAALAGVATPAIDATIRWAERVLEESWLDPEGRLVVGPHTRTPQWFGMERIEDVWVA